MTTSRNSKEVTFVCVLQMAWAALLVNFVTSVRTPNHMLSACMSAFVGYCNDRTHGVVSAASLGRCRRSLVNLM
jgi:hypothetical protein